MTSSLPRIAKNRLLYCMQIYNPSHQSSPIHPQKYQELTGSIQWLAGTTRPDIAFLASYLARFAAAPRETHWQMALRVVSYLVQTKEKGLILHGMPEGKRDSMGLEGWVDADLAGCLDSRCSMTGYIFKVGDSIVDWQSKRQATASPSTLESDCMAMSEAAKHGVHRHSNEMSNGCPDLRCME